jgi:DNA modification methylase
VSVLEVLRGERAWWIACTDVLVGLKAMPDESVNCVVTSPPYWGLRDYQVEGQIGLEPTPDAFVAKLVAVFREVRRVLRRDGVLWCNLGDSYAGSWGAQSRPGCTDAGRLQGGSMLSARQILAHPKGQTHTGSLKNTPGLKNKDLIGVPWRVALGLQADGWYLRSDIIWSKPNPMPSSVLDRPTTSHEYVFLLARSERYWYDADAIRERTGAEADAAEYAQGIGANTGADADRLGAGYRKNSPTLTHPLGRNRRSVWTIPTEAFPAAHFATFPTALVEPCVLAGCPEDGVVLDPFNGAGTTGVVARRLGRRYVGLEINPAYAEMARKRIIADQGIDPKHAAEVNGTAQLRLLDGVA